MDRTHERKGNMLREGTESETHCLHTQKSHRNINWIPKCRGPGADPCWQFLGKMGTHSPSYTQRMEHKNLPVLPQNTCPVMLTAVPVTIARN